MSVKVQKYLLNMAKSVTYSTADVLSEKFTYAKDFKNENREVFNEVYHSVKDYRTTFARLKKTITNNKIVDAARVGYDSILYSITTGDFYAKNKETEVIEKYGGNLMSDMDIDDDDFDFEKKDDVSEGDMVIATAVKKNSKIQTAITTEAIAKTGKAQMDVAKENTMLLYTQNERLINKLDGGLTNITEFLKQRDEETAKVQNKMNENLNKFMTNVDNNVAKLTAQMDELLEMQRNMYKPVKPEEKNKKDGFYDIIDRSGVINLKAYASQVKKQALNTVMDSIPGMSMLFGDSMGEGTNLLAQIAANPMRELSKGVINKMLGTNFDKAAKDLNKTLELMVPNIIAKLTAQGKKEDNGIKGILGKIFGLKIAGNESVNTGAYQKGAIPFDGMTKKAITDVIPFYLKKMTSALTGGEEMAFDFNTGRWTSMRAVNKQYSDLINAEKNTVSAAIKQHMSNGTGRSFESMFSTKDQLDKANNAVNSLSLKLAAAGDFGSLNMSDLTLEERTIYKTLQSIWRRTASKREEDIWIDGKPGKAGKIRRQGPSIAEFNAQLRSAKISHNQGIKQLNETGGIAMLAAQEGLTGDVKNYFGKSYVDSNGDISDRRLQELPMTQALIRGKDEYGHTLFEYLRNMGSNLTVIKAYSQYLQNLPFINNNGNGGNGGNPPPDPSNLNNILSSNSIDFSSEAKKDLKFASEYYKKLREDEKKKANDSHLKAVEKAKESARKKGNTISFATSLSEFRSEGDDIGLHRLVSDYEADYEAHAQVEYMKEEEKKKNEKWKKLEEFLGKESTDKLKKVDEQYDADKTLTQNLANAKTTTEKILIMGKWMAQKTNVNAMEKVTNTLIKTDAWLKDLIYGNDLNPEDQKKSLWQLMKDHTTKFFDWTKETISKNIVDPIKKWYEDSWLKKGLRKVFGKTDSMGNIEEEGLMSYFVSGFKKGMHKNADDVRAIYKEEARKAREAAERAGIIKPREDSDSSSNGSSGSSDNSNNPKLTGTQKRAARRTEIINKLQNDVSGDNSFIAENAADKLIRIGVYNRKQQQTESYSSDAVRESRKANIIAQTEKTIENKERQIENNNVKIAEATRQMDATSDYLEKAQLYHKINIWQTQNEKTQKSLEQDRQKLEGIRRSTTRIKHMASGGINLTGRSFKSVLSPGEMVISGGGVSKVGSMGVYNIPAGAAVVNPASKTTQSVQAVREKNFARGLRYNANTDDNLQPVESEEDKKKREESEKKHKEAMERIEQVDIDKLTDWRTLTDSKQRAAFLGNMASRGLIGGVAGLLVGGPLLGAAVGAASSLTKSTDAFGEFLFGKAEKDADGNVIVDEHGYPKRADDGLVSKELQKAAPDMSKLGLVGLGAGMLTGLGPLAGLMLGSGLGFAKNAEAFQGTLFGDGGIISDENIDKLKKGAKNMGIGAATAALFLPGPFGLVGSALIGATAGYATSTDKFKDFLLGEEDADGKRKGGVKGALIDNVVNPLKDFGNKIVDKTLDELFGPEGEDGKRNTDEGLFGAIRANVVKPMISGAQSIFKEITNTIVDIKDFTVDMFKRIRANAAGNDFLGGLWEKAGKVGSGIIGAAGKVGRAATKPFRLIGDEGIGGHFKKKRIRNGRADDMTARERLKARGDFGLSAIDEWSGFDEFLIGLNHEEKESLLNILEYDENAGEIENKRNKAYDVLGQELRKNISRKDAKKILRMVRDGRQNDIERYLDRKNIDETARKNILKEISNHKTKMERAERDYDEMRNKGLNTQKYLNEHNIGIDVSDARKLKNLKLMTHRELAHDAVGLTEEEIAWQNEKNFWQGADTPLKTVNQAATNMEKMLEMIHYDLTIGDKYDKLSDEEKAKYGSKQEYIDKIKAAKVQGTIIKQAGNNKFTPGKYSKIGALDVDTIKKGDALTNDLWNDYLPFWTGDFKSTMAADDRIRSLISDELDELIETACQMFDGLALKELCVPECVKDDITAYTNKIMSEKHCTEEEARAQIKVMKRKVVIVRNDKKYSFEMIYKLDGGTINAGKGQPASYDVAKREFVEDYLQDHKPKTVEDSYLSFGDMISNTLKLGVYLRPMRIPGIPLLNANVGGFVRDAIKTYAKKGLKAIPMIGRKAKFEIGQVLGSHKLNEKSFIQQTRDYKYKFEAEQAFNREVQQYLTSYIKIQNITSVDTSGYDEKELNRHKAHVNAIKEKEGPNLVLLDSITKKLELDNVYIISKNNDTESMIKVHDEYVNMYVESRREGQILGHGLVGNVKQVAKAIGESKIGKLFKFTSGAYKILFRGGANQGKDKEERKAKLMESLKKKAEVAWGKMFKPSIGDNGQFVRDSKGNVVMEPASDKLVQLVHELYDDVKGKSVLWSDLTEGEQKAIHDVFIQRFVQGRYNELLDPLFTGDFAIQRWAAKAAIKIKAKGARAVDWAKEKKNKAKESLNKEKQAIIKERLLSDAIKHNDERLDEIAMEKYDKKYDELTDDEKTYVHNKFYVEYGRDVTTFKGLMLEKVKGRVGRNLGKVKSLTEKSGIKNSVNGKLDAVRKWKEKNQEQDTLIGKFFDRMDARQLRKDREKFEGKKDSKLAKLMKWLFVGGVAVPLFVGVLKEDILPAIKKTVAPWLKKAKDKIFGVKDEKTGEYKGGVISGIVNPIRNLFKDKLQKVHDWIHNEGEYGNDNVGLSGFMKGLSKIGEYLINRWKEGFTTVYGSFIPKLLTGIGKNIIPGIWNIAKGLGQYLADVIIHHKRGAMEFDLGGASMDISSPATSTQVPTSVGGSIELKTEGVNSKIDIPATDKNGNEIKKESASDNEASAVPGSKLGSKYTNTTTGNSYTTRTDSNFYYVGENSNGVPVYKDNKTNKSYTVNDSGEYVPISEAEEAYDSSLSENEVFQRQKELENANALNADYTSSSAGKKAGMAFGRTVLRSNNMIIMNGARGAQVMNSAGKIMTAPTKPLRLFGLKGKAIDKAVSTGVNATGLASRATVSTTEKVLGKTGLVLDKYTGGAITKLGEKQITKEAENAAIYAAKHPEKAKKAADAAARAALKEKEETAKAIAKKAAKADKLAKAAEDGNLFAKVIQWLKSKKAAIAKKISDVLKDSKVAKFLGKNITDNADKVGEEIADGVTKIAENNADEIAEQGAKTAAKGFTKVLSIAMMVIDFFLGVDNCRNLLGIATKKPSFIERVTGGLINIIPDVIMTLAELIAGASFGAAAPISAVLTVLSFVATFIISFDGIRDPIISVCINALEKCGLDMSKIKKEREDAKQAVEAYNAKNNTNLSLAEYNNLDEETMSGATKFGKGVSNAVSGVFGYDAATKKSLKEYTKGLDTKGKSDKVIKKLNTIFSEIWQKFGKDYFNFAAYDEDGNKLDKKKKLNANQAKFTECTKQIVSGLNEILIEQDNSVIKDVLSNACEYKGPLDAAFNLKKTFKEGYDNPTSQFNVDAEHADWKRIKGMAGICAIMNEIFEPCNRKADVSKVIVEAMMPAYFNADEINAINNAENKTVDESMYNVNTGSIDGAETTIGVEEGTEFVGPTLPTNAKTNDKLTPFKNAFTKNLLDDGGTLGRSLSETISKAIASITGGGMSGIGEIIKSLQEKNKQINRKIDALRLLPTDDEYWNIIMDDKHPFASSLFSFTENISRVIKAPFSLAASMNMSTAKILSSNSAVTSGSAANATTTASTTGTVSSTSKNNSTSTAESTKSSSGNILTKLWGGLKGAVSKLFGKGKGDTDETDPYHIYQRDFNESFNTSGDTERQTIADSGCGPASAASVLRMYGKRGSMKNAANYAIRGGYKEKDGGTYPEYFNDYLNSNGISTNSNASNADVINNLANGKPVILMGRNMGKNANTPYGNKYSHYVVAKGIDRNGNLIVEDSEDKKGNTRYNLADTLRNTSVRITTGSGKYGRANDNMSVNDRYISNVNAVISGTVSSTIAAAINGAIVNSGLVTTGETKTTSNVSGDAKAALGKSLTLSDGKGNTHTIKITQDEVDMYSMLTGDCGLSPAAACGAMGNWEQECGINSVREIACKGVIYYGGGIMQWTPGDKHTTWAAQNGYGSDPWSWEANLAHAKDEIMTGGNWNNPKNADPSFESEGLKPVSSFAEFKVLSDPESAAANFERVFEVSGDWNGRNSEGVVYKANMIHDNLRRLNAKILYELIVNGKEGTETGKGKLFGRAKSKFGRADDDTTTTMGPKTFEETIADNDKKEVVAADFNGPLKENQVREGSEEDTTETTTDDTTKKTKSSVSSEETKGLISLLGKYAKKLTKGIFGNFYDALYGSEPTTADATTSSSSAEYNGSDIVYAAAMVFDALSRANPNCVYDNSCTTYYDLECQDGTKLEHVRPDCSGLMTAVIQYMGYYTYSCGRTLSETYHGEGLNDQHMKPEEFMDASGNPTNDFEIIKTSDAIGSGARPGDIRITSGHTDMFCYYDSNGSPRGFNAGSPSGMKISYELASKYISDGNKLPTDGYGDYTIGDGSTSWVLRYKGSASGRGKKLNLAKLNMKPRRNYVLTDAGKIYVSEINAKKNNKFSRYGKSYWGRADEEETTETTTPTTTTDAETTAETSDATTEATTTTTSTTTTTNAKSLINDLSKYAKKAVKGVYGKFYDALYGNEAVATTDDGSTAMTGTAGCLNSAIPYSTYSIWKQCRPGNNGPTWNCDTSWNTKHVISIGGQDIGSSGCSLVSTALMLAHSGVVQDASFDPAKLADDVNTRPECTAGCGYPAALQNVCHYQGKDTMSFVSDDQWNFGGKSFDELYNYVVSSMQQGYFLMGHVSNHYCCIDYVDTAHKIIFIMDPAFSVNCWYDGENKPDVLDSTDAGYTMTDGPEHRTIQGVVRYKSSTTDASAYLLNGRRSFDSLHPNGGAPNATISGEGKYGRSSESVVYPKVTGKQGPQRLPSGEMADADNHSMRNNRSFTAYELKKARASGSGRGIVNESFYGDSAMGTTNSNYHGSARGSTSNSNYHGSSGYGGTGGSDLTEIIKLITTIANNSDKMDSLLAILGTIAVNTENTAKATTTKTTTNSKPNTPKNGLAALRTALDNSNNGQDIINAIYQIAKA